MGERKTVLVVDDDTFILTLVERMLYKEFNVLTSSSGVAALDTLSDEVDLVILDLMMPNMDGLEVCQKIRERSDVPVIVLTALEDRSGAVVTGALQAGANDYMNKPLAASDLRERIHALTT